MVTRFLSFLGTNQYFLGFSSLCGVIGFVLTIIVTIKTSKISKILRHNAITSQYNKERIGFQNTFEGHRKSITVDGLQSKQLLTDILKNVEAYRADYNLICNYLASISGRLSKKGDLKNG